MKKNYATTIFLSAITIIGVLITINSIQANNTIQGLSMTGTCQGPSQYCTYQECCTTAGQTCTIQPQGSHCTQTTGNNYHCTDMGNSMCQRDITIG